MTHHVHKASVKFHQAHAQAQFAGASWEASVAAVTHWGIGAHQDDVEIMAAHGIIAGQGSGAKFGAVIASDGKGSSRQGKYQHFSDEQMSSTRIQEQAQAAQLGHYHCLVQLAQPSSVIKNKQELSLESDLEQLLSLARPQVVYTHNLADKHETHVALSMRVIQVLRKLPKQCHPNQLLGCEVWRGLDWMDDKTKVPMNISGHEQFIQQLINCHDSQTQGGKRYDLATLGRMRANATFFEATQTDQATHVWYAMDLTQLLTDPTQDIADFVMAHIERFKQDVTQKIKRYV